MKYEGKEIGSKNCGVTQICIAVAMLVGAFLTLAIVAFVMKFMA